MGLLDALDESIATVEAEHQEKGSPTTATLASTAAAPPASCGTYERTVTRYVPLRRERLLPLQAVGEFLVRRQGARRRVVQVLPEQEGLAVLRE